MLGSLDLNTGILFYLFNIGLHLFRYFMFSKGDTSLGWDTDQFLMDPKLATIVMYTIINQNGMAPGGLNFDCKIRRESTDLEDVFISHIGSMDNLAFGLKKAAQIYSDKILSNMVNERYLSFSSTDLGEKIENGSATFEDCEEFVKSKGEPKPISAKQEKFERIFNNYFV